MAKMLLRIFLVTSVSSAFLLEQARIILLARNNLFRFLLPNVSEAKVLDLLCIFLQHIKAFQLRHQHFDNESKALSVD